MPVRAGRNAGFLREIRKDVHRMRLFDVLGPVMIGPSSSHTAGAAKIGYTAQKLLGDLPVEADIGLYGSFATTGKGHGTDRALVAGLLGLRPDDPRLPDSFALAQQQGMTVPHPPGGAPLSATRIPPS